MPTLPLGPSFLKRGAALLCDPLSFLVLSPPAQSRWDHGIPLTLKIPGRVDANSQLLSFALSKSLLMNWHIRSTFPPKRESQRICNWLCNWLYRPYVLSRFWDIKCCLYGADGWADRRRVGLLIGQTVLSRIHQVTYSECVLLLDWERVRFFGHNWPSDLVDHKSTI